MFEVASWFNSKVISKIYFWVDLMISDRLSFIHPWIQSNNFTDISMTFDTGNYSYTETKFIEIGCDRSFISPRSHTNLLAEFPFRHISPKYKYILTQFSKNNLSIFFRTYVPNLILIGYFGPHTNILPKISLKGINHLQPRVEII